MMSENKPLIDQILDDWQVDAKWDRSEPGVAISNIPNLHAKYVRLLTKHNLLVRKCDQDITRIRRQKFDYYNGRMDQQELEKYGLKPFKFVLKNEVKEYVDSDDQVLELQARKANHQQIVELCESILKELQNRTWQLSNYMKFEMYLQGQ